jgi:Amt family ammonium transporter
VLSLLIQCLALTALMSLLWLAGVYSLAFAEGNAFFGSFADKLFLRGIGPDALWGTIPELLFFAFQMTFAVITPALMIGAFAERMRFSAMLIFSSLWLIVVYAPICHMTWGGGLFSEWGVLDFAGGIVVHITAGVAALVTCIVIGPREGYPRKPMPPHNLTMTFMGTAMLWVGWFGFNAGSALGANGSAAMALVVTHLSACAATITWMAIEWVKFGKPSVLGPATGSIAGLAAVTPASGYIGPVGGVAIGIVAGAICWYAATALKRRLGYDDSLDVFGVHGIGGMWGALATAIFIAEFAAPEGVSWGGQIWIQVQSILFTIVFSCVLTLGILFALRLVFGNLRVSPEDEQLGLDLAEHSEAAYDHAG